MLRKKGFEVITQHYQPLRDERPILNMRRDCSLTYFKVQDIKKTRNRQFRGLARLDLEVLDFGDVLGEAKHRPLSPRNVTRLRKVFELEGCNRYDEANYISAFVHPARLDGLTITGPSQYPVDVAEIPRVTFGQPVRCLNGLHRIRAAQEHLDPNDRWWTVKLYTEGTMIFLNAKDPGHY